MNFHIKRLQVATGSIRVVVLHEDTAYNLGLKSSDRVRVHARGSRKKIVAILDTTKNHKFVGKNQIGVFAELHNELPLAKNTIVSIAPLPKPEAVFAIQRKLHGETLSRKDFEIIINSITNNELTDIEMTYFVSGCYANDLTEDEIYHLTDVMVKSGDILTFKSNKPIIDKHCIGGVAGNRTTTLVVPIIAAAGYLIPKTSSRSITSPAGTSDTMEVLCNVTLSDKQIKDTVKKTGGCLAWGGGLDLAPADDKIIHVEHPMALDPVGQLIASVLAKKRSVSATHVLIDIPLGKGAKIESKKRAQLLQSLFEKIGKKLGMNVLAIITDGSQPIGNGIGPALEAREILWTLQNDAKGSLQLKQKAIKLAGIIFDFVEGTTDGKKKAKQIVESGQAYAKFLEILTSQGLVTSDPDSISVGKKTFNVLAKKKGKITHIDNKIISRIARLLGAPSDRGAGVYLHRHKKDVVKKGDILFTLYANDATKFTSVKEYVSQNTGYIIK